MTTLEHFLLHTLRKSFCRSQCTKSSCRQNAPLVRISFPSIKDSALALSLSMSIWKWKWSAGLGKVEWIQSNKHGSLIAYFVFRFSDFFCLHDWTYYRSSVTHFAMWKTKYWAHQAEPCHARKTTRTTSTRTEGKQNSVDKAVLRWRFHWGPSSRAQTQVI